MVRRIEAQDVDGLADLYAGLDGESLRRRFFSAYRPERPFFERMAAVDDRGGAGLVAVVTDGGDPGHIVAECAYELLPDGNGEVAITVERDWRGWMGPFLLDALVEVAASRGVPGLEADILTTNGPMLALFRSRGYVAIPNGDWTVVRAMIGTATPMPTWPDHRRRLRVLVEGMGGQWHAADTAKEAGLDVLVCPGPAGDDPKCPALAGDPCPLAAGADVIVISHPNATDSWAALREAHRRLHPAVPTAVEVGERDGVATAGEVVLPTGSTADVIAVVRRLAELHGGSGPAASTEA